MAKKPRKPPPANRQEQGRFKPGRSGNPSGRPKVVAEIRDLARQFSAQALKTLVEIATKGADERARVAAANSLLDRGFGKPTQTIEAKVEGPRAIQIITPLTSGLADDPANPGR